MSYYYLLFPTVTYYYLLLPTITYYYLLLPTATYYLLLKYNLLLPTTAYYCLLLLLPTIPHKTNKQCKTRMPFRQHWFRNYVARNIFSEQVVHVITPIVARIFNHLQSSSTIFNHLRQTTADDDGDAPEAPPWLEETEADTVAPPVEQL